MSETDEVKSISWDMIAQKNDVISAQAAQIEAMKKALEPFVSAYRKSKEQGRPPSSFLTIADWAAITLGKAEK